ncbi:MAG TPA: CpsB/CapC family capsule biosynthesis tyrosine phosphatase [Terriglobales bacterium]|nr:CpsB/CapC family capsule biosynthesis tyrosine phosphatase [Terriglobales bacterium]
MVDIHSHVLPEVDDGAKSWDVAVQMCRMAAEDGVTDLVATPHANDRYPYHRQRHQEIVSRLQGMVGLTPTLHLGCDFHFSYDNIQDALAHCERYVIGKTAYLLVEFSDFALPPTLLDALYRLQSGGLTPIVTHPERNPLLQRQPEQILRLVEMGCVIQVTAASLTGRFGKAARRLSGWLLQREAVHVLASDAHDLEDRPPILSAGRDVAVELCGPDVALALVEHNPRAIVSNQPLPYFPHPRPD